MHSSTSSFKRPIPEAPWRGLTVIVVVALLILAAVWEIYCRTNGYAPTLNDTEDLWAQARRRVQPESIVIVGDSRAIFDLDLDELSRGMGKRPVQLAQPGSCAYPVLSDLAKDEHFHGTVICSIVPRLFFAPPEAPPYSVAQKAIRRFHDQTYAQRVSQVLGMWLEENVAFLKADDLTLAELLKRLPIPDRPQAQVPPKYPPYFATLDRERRARMIERCALPGELQTRVARGWIPLFTPPPPPGYVPRDAFIQGIMRAIENRFRDTKFDVNKIRGRGGKVLFLRLPMSGELKTLEDQQTPRAQFWDRLIGETMAPDIYFEDFPDLAGFTCPEWSHLSAGDSVEYTRRLVPFLRTALEK